MINPPSRDSKSDLLDAARAAIRDGEEKALLAAIAAREKPRKRRMGVLAVIGVAGIVILIMQPMWLVGPKALPAETPAVAAASLRLEMFRHHSLIVNFTKAHGRLPTNLAEAGDRGTVVRYERTGDSTFRLTATVGDSLIVLQSTDSMEAFLGRAIAAIRNRGQQ
jgi:hypothetical protein